MIELEAPKYLNRSCDLTTPISGVVCHRWAFNSSYDIASLKFKYLLIYNITVYYRCPRFKENNVTLIKRTSSAVHKIMR